MNFRKGIFNVNVDRICASGAFGLVCYAKLAPGVCL
jgi:hypothetical protein